MKNTFQLFLDIYLKNGFQSLSKKDIDLLIFYFMEQANLIKEENSYEKAKYLKITPKKLANLQLESYMRWGEENREQVLKNFFHKAFAKESLDRILSEQDDLLQKRKISLTIENSVEKLQLERTLKEIASNIEYTLNKEVIVVNIKTLFEILYFAEIDKEKIQDILKDIEKIDIKQLLTRKDFRSITFEEYRKNLNKIGFETMREIGKTLIGKLGGLIG